MFHRRRLLAATTALTLGAAMMPLGAFAQDDGPIRIGHLTPRTGFLGPLGEYAVMAADLAVEEINAAGGINGRMIEVIKEDSVNPQTASTKAERMIERDNVVAIVGEISSASALTISQVTDRARRPFLNTGANSDTLRGDDCKRFMFHVETQNAMYVNAEGQYLQSEGLVDGKNWYLLTADYAFGHDLLDAARVFLDRTNGNIAGDDLVPTDATDFSSYLLKIREAKPDVVVSNLAGTQITSFLKQYTEFGLDAPVGGFGFDTASAWAAGGDNFKGTWPTVWTHQVDTERSQEFVKAFTDKYGKPPENQAFGDYTAMHILAQAIGAVGTDGDALVGYLENPENTFDVMKSRPAYFNPKNHQLMQEVYTITALPPGEQPDQWDIFTTSEPVPAPDQPLETLIEAAVGGECSFGG